ncbi:hypothetical protein P5X12_13955, partial [Enterobacter hormaechei]|nr:hypothetical protein [Enterobacter hormaechei]
NRLIRCVCGKKIGPDPRNFNQRVSLGRNDLLIRTFPNVVCYGAIAKSILFGVSLDHWFRSLRPPDPAHLQESEMIYKGWFFPAFSYLQHNPNYF